MKIAIITGTTRPGRKSLAVAEWVKSIADERTDATYEIVDIAEYDLPLFDEPMPTAYGQYANDHTKRFNAKIGEFDGYVMVTGEYNHSTPAALTNAITFPYNEWVNKAVGFVGYGSLGGSRSIENLRLMAAELQMADVRTAAYLSLFDDFEEFTTLAPRDNQKESVNGMLDQLVAWAGAMKTLREGANA
ncbi:MAG: NAD(P)H-dependent oxidoreductase [Propionibacteriaceae bacterium]|nr:NAD(P)H-dependent oxidoreductase [Propionibacteriaceae bacterium]